MSRCNACTPVNVCPRHAHIEIRDSQDRRNLVVEIVVGVLILAFAIAVGLISYGLGYVP